MSKENVDNTERQMKPKKESWYDQNFKTILIIGLWIGFSAAIWCGLHFNPNINWPEEMKILMSAVFSGIFLLLIKFLPSF